MSARLGQQRYLSASVEQRLLQFFGCWFHQDWDIEGSDWRQVMAALFRESQSRALAQLHRDLSGLLKVAPSTKPDLQEYLRQLGCDYWPSKQSGREWLGDVVATIADELKARGAPQSVD